MQLSKSKLGYQTVYDEQELDLLAKILNSGTLNATEERVLRGYRKRCLNGKLSVAGDVETVRSDQMLVSAIHVILPAFNEEESLPSLLHRFAELDLDTRLIVWVVDDGSSDATADIAQCGVPGLDVRLVSHRKNLGLGQALQTGMRTVTQLASPEDIVIVMDADDTHDTRVLFAMQDHIQNGADIVVASRFVEGGDDRTAPLFRRFLSLGASWVFKACLPLSGIQDFTSGFRAYRVNLIRAAIDQWGQRLVEERGFACMVELLLKLRYFNPVIKEVPLVLRYDRKRGQSKLKLGRTLVQYLKLAVRDRLAPPPVGVI